jgi:hypothetical protein
MNMRKLAITALSSLLMSYGASAGGSILRPQESHVHEHEANGTPAKIVLASNDVAVPMQIQSRIPVVEATINGKGPFRFFIDTGAGATVLNDDLVKELQLPVIGSTRIGDPSDPQGIAASNVSVDALEIGGASFRNFTAVSWDRSKPRPGDAPRGVLGIPLFVDLLLTLDYPAKKVVIGRGALSAANGRDIVNFKHGEANLFSVPITVSGVETQATLDSGGGGSGLGFPTDYMKKLPLISKPVEVGRGRMAGGEVVIYAAKLKGSVKVGDHVFEEPTVHFNGRLRHINLGSELLSKFSVTIDQKNQRIRFKEPPVSSDQGTKNE